MVLAALLLFPFLIASGQYIVTAKEDFFACKDKATFEHAKDAVRAQDQDAVLAVTLVLVAMSGPEGNGECFQYSKGERLQFLDTEILSGYMVVRKRGLLGRYYTPRQLLGNPVRGTLAPPRNEAPEPVRTLPPKRPPRPASAPAAQGDWKCLEPDLEFSIRQAENSSQRMMLTRTKGLTVLGFTIQDRGWQTANEPSEVALGIDGRYYSRPARYGLPEIELDDVLAAALRSGLKLSVTIRSAEGNAHHYDASLIGFTRAHDCVMDGETRLVTQARKPTPPPKRTINVIPDGQRIHYARGEVHALKQIVSMCMLIVASLSEDISMKELAEQVGKMQGFQNPDGLPEYFNKGVSDTFSRMQRTLESTKEP